MRQDDFRQRCGLGRVAGPTVREERGPGGTGRAVHRPFADRAASQGRNRWRLVAFGHLAVLMIAECLVSGAELDRKRIGAEATVDGGGVAVVERGAMDPGIPTPESVIGHDVWAKAVRYELLVRYSQALADSSPRVRLTPYGRSHEGRELFYLTIASEANFARLAQIRRDNARLADPRTLSGAEEAERILDQLPGIAWMAYSIHGDELSSTDAAMEVAYRLAAGKNEGYSRLREQLVVHIDPLMNPDGRERYLGQLQHLTGKVSNPDYQAIGHQGLWGAGRGNHYLFDMNRDWLVQIHPETRGRTAAMLSWHPHLVVDSHEMGGLSTYLFSPPREPINIYQSTKTMEWRRRFSAEHAAAFDRYGWSYYTREWNEEWYPGYTNAWATLLGSVSLLYEQAGVDAASVRQATGDEITYREAVEHHLVSSFANLETLAANRREILEDLVADRRWAVSDKGPHAETFLLPPLEDRSKLERFVDVLRRQEIEFVFADAEFEARSVVDVWGERFESKVFPAGTLVVRSSQPHRRLLHAMLAFDPHMSNEALLDEREHLENHRGTRIYDITAWNIPMAYGLEAYWADRVRKVSGRAEIAWPGDLPHLAGEEPKYGYVIDGADGAVYEVLVRLFDRGCKPRVAVKPFHIAGREFKAGAVLLRRHENPLSLEQALAESVDGVTVDVVPVDTALSQAGPDLGGNRFRLLREPRVALASQWPMGSTSFGYVWHLLDYRIGLRVSPINVQRLGGIDLRKYNVLILPGARSGLHAVMGDGVRRKIRTWVEAGGTLIAFGSSAAFLANKERGLSAVRLRRDVLGELEVYEEALELERKARSVRVDPAQVWGAGKVEPKSPTSKPAGEEDGASGSERKSDKSDVEALQRKDQWQRIFKPRGAIAGAWLDDEHWLCFGLGNRLPMLVNGSNAFMSKHPVATPVRLMDTEHVRLSGLMWPEARERLAGMACATVERMDRGQVILFATDPCFRGYFEGSGRLLLNAVILGPGMCSSAPVPW